MPRILVTPAALADGIDDIARGLAGIDAQLQQLQTDLAPLVATWSGAAAGSYAQYQRDWDAAAAAMQENLAIIHRIATIAHRNYSAAESANQRIWGL